jgi:hypothetical protein
LIYPDALEIKDNRALGLPTCTSYLDIYEVDEKQYASYSLQDPGGYGPVCILASLIVTYNSDL